MSDTDKVILADIQKIVGVCIDDICESVRDSLEVSGAGSGHNQIYDLAVLEIFKSRFNLLLTTELSKIRYRNVSQDI